MNIDHRNPRLRRGFAFVALAALLGLSVFGLSQCRMVNDSVTGADLNAATGTHSRNSCVRECNERRKACVRAEDARHKAARKACGDDQACKKAEQRFHHDNKKACRAESQLCKRGCYNEGAGGAGR